jgi:hypothetical protein
VSAKRRKGITRAGNDGGVGMAMDDHHTQSVAHGHCEKRARGWAWVLAQLRALLTNKKPGNRDKILSVKKPFFSSLTTRYFFSKIFYK